MQLTDAAVPRTQRAKEPVKLTSRLVMAVGWRMEEDWKPGSYRACALRPEGWGQG